MHSQLPAGIQFQPPWNLPRRPQEPGCHGPGPWGLLLDNRLGCQGTGSWALPPAKLLCAFVLGLRPCVPPAPGPLLSFSGGRRTGRRHYLHPDPGPSEEFPEGLFLVVAARRSLTRGRSCGRGADAGRREAAGFPRLVRAGQVPARRAPGPGGQVGGSEARGAGPGRAGSAASASRRKAPAAGGARGGLRGGGRSRAGGGLRHSGLGPRSGRAGGDPGAGRWAALAAACRAARGGAGGGSVRGREAEGRRAAGLGR